MIELDVNQELAPETERLPQALLDSIKREVNERVPKMPEGTITVSYVSDQEIQRLNRMYRGIDQVTDVLSFGYGANGHVGDVAIAFAQAKRQAEGDLELELTDLLVHGILHVLGYDHEEPEDAAEMFPLQDTIVHTVL